AVVSEKKMQQQRKANTNAPQTKAKGPRFSQQKHHTKESKGPRLYLQNPLSGKEAPGGPRQTPRPTALLHRAELYPRRLAASIAQKKRGGLHRAPCCRGRCSWGCRQENLQ